MRISDWSSDVCSSDLVSSGRGFILGDETGIGKGRVLASTTTWASKKGQPVIFITDRSTLFSDLARDLRDIGEWERFRPVITNADEIGRASCRDRVCQ